ncbi:MAG: TRAP transporter TatT component family protein, partial [Polyangiaceae bacterium]
MFLIGAALSVGSSGCIMKILTDGQIQATRQASVSFDTVGDVDLARSAAEASFGQFEGMHALAPYNSDALYLLMKTWAGYGAGFIVDEIERAQDKGDDAMEDYQRKRARMAFDRAVFYGLQLLAQTAEGFGDAKKNEMTLTKWLNASFKNPEDAPNLLWTGVAWLSRADVMKGDEDEGPIFIADVFVGVALIQRAVDLDPSVDNYTGLIALASYHARNGMAEPDEAKKILDTALAKTEGKNLLVPLAYATTYACVKGDSSTYQQMLDKVLNAGDPNPYIRLENALAKRRAKRWASKKRAKEYCGFDLGAAAAQPSAAPAPAAAPAAPAAVAAPAASSAPA